MGAFRAFPYRGSLLRFQSGAVQEVFHEPMSAKVWSSHACMLLGQNMLHCMGVPSVMAKGRATVLAVGA